MRFTDNIFDDIISDIVVTRFVFTAVQQIFDIAVSPFYRGKREPQRRQSVFGDAVDDAANDVTVDVDITDDTALADVFPPGFKLRFYKGYHDAARCQKGHDGRHDFEEGNKGDVDGNEVHRLADIGNGDVSDIGPFHIDNAIIGPQFPSQLTVADVDAKTFTAPR